MGGNSKAFVEARKKIYEEYKKEFPHLLKKPMARRLYADHPDMFTSVENARNFVRRREGSAGKRSRRKGERAPDPVNMREIMAQYYHLDGDKEVVTHQIPTAYTRIGVTGDWQMPFHDHEAIVRIFERFEDADINCLYLNGDIIDAVRLSSFCRDVNARNFSYELDLWYEYASMIRDRWPDIPIYYKKGNHEDRYERFMYSKSKDLIGVPEFDFNYIMSFQELKIKPIEAWDHTDLKDMRGMHGHEFGGYGSRVSPARSMYGKVNGNFWMGHGHITDTYERTRNTGESIRAYMHGCACQLQPRWKPYAYVDWNHGALIHYRNKDGTTKSVDNFRV